MRPLYYFFCQLECHVLYNYASNLTYVAWVCRTFEALMWKKIILWGMAILWGYQRVVYQLTTSNELWPKKKNCLSFPQVFQFLKEGLQNIMLPRATCKLHWSWTLWMLWWKYHYAWQNWRMDWSYGAYYMSYEES